MQKIVEAVQKESSTHLKYTDAFAIARKNPANRALFDAYGKEGAECHFIGDASGTGSGASGTIAQNETALQQLGSQALRLQSVFAGVGLDICHDDCVSRILTADTGLASRVNAEIAADAATTPAM